MFLGLTRSRGSAAAVLALLFLAAEPAAAQDKAAAESLFESGVQLMKAGRFAEACPKLDASQRVDPAVGTLLYLAECYEKLGKTASAWATFREAESLGRSSNQMDRARTAQQRAQRLESELSYLTINLASDLGIDGLVVRRSGTVVLPDLYGVAAPVDPGVVEIEATAPGYKRYSAQVKVTPRAKEVAVIPALEAEPRGADAPPVAPAAAAAGTQPATSGSSPPASPHEDVPPKSGPNHTAAYVLGGIGIVGIGVGSYFGLRAFSKNSDAEDNCDEQVCNTAGMDLTQEAENAALVSNIGFVVGGAALATGLVLFFTAGDGDEKTTLRVSPLVARSGGGVSVGGSFR